MFILVCLALLFSPRPSDATELRAKTDAIFAEWNHTDTPGCAVAVFKDGEIVYEHGFGMASLALSVPITPQTVFDIGSTSKQFTAACIGLLAQDGKLSLDDDIKKFLPEMRPTETPITIRHLLNHTSGLRDYIEIMSLAGTREQDHTTCAEALAAITRQTTQNFAPGAQHLYSNTGYFLLAQIVERVSQKSFAEFARARIFDPLGMRHTQVLDDCTRIVQNRADSYEPGEIGFSEHTSDWEQTGDGAVQTTVGDLQRWDENFYSGKVGGAALRAMLTTRGALNDGTSIDYCAGLMVGKTRGLDTVRHGGAWVGFRAEMLRFPAQHFTVVCLCNLGSMNASGLADQVAAVWLESEMSAETTAPTALDTRPAVELAAGSMKPYVGQYRHDATIVSIALDGETLSLSGTNVRPGRLTPLGQGRFRRDGGGRPLDVVFEGGAMRFDFKNGTEWKFTTFEPWVPALADLTRYVGSYWSDEIGAALELAIVDGALTVVGHRTLSPMQLSPLARDEFTCGLGRMLFRTTPEAVSGFVVDGGRAKGLAYVRR